MNVPTSQNHIGLVFAELHVVGEDVDLQELTRLFGVEPLAASYTNVPASFASGSLSVGKAFGIWSFSTRERVASHDVHEHIDYIVRFLERSKSEIEEKRPPLSLRLHLHWESSLAGSGAGPEIKFDRLIHLGMLRITLAVQCFRCSAGG